MDTRTITLEHIKKGDILFIVACSQCGSNATISLDGGLTPPIKLVKNTGDSNLTMLKGDYSTVKIDDTPVQLTISIEKASTMKVIKTGTILSDIEGKEKGIQYVFTIEDHTDNDFNDYYISIVAWHQKN